MLSAKPLIRTGDATEILTPSQDTRDLLQGQVRDDMMGEELKCFRVVFEQAHDEVAEP